jgi:hypothetical protein
MDREVAAPLHYSTPLPAANRAAADWGTAMFTATTELGRDQEPEAIPEVRLWQAVIVSSVQEWLHGPLRRQREAERFLFNDDTDFPVVCQSAGLDAGQLRERLSKLRDKGAMSADAKVCRN